MVSCGFWSRKMKQTVSYQLEHTAMCSWNGNNRDWQHRKAHRWMNSWRHGEQLLETKITCYLHRITLNVATVLHCRQVMEHPWLSQTSNISVRRFTECRSCFPATVRRETADSEHALHTHNHSFTQYSPNIYYSSIFFRTALHYATLIKLK